uniref:Uncharacterized protein n=1 Tax=Leersia perrieri TaxID=77586 RepID=A0A0D9WR16_9ORYZ
MSGYSSTDSEATLDLIPPAVIDADLDEEETMSAMSPMLNPQGSDPPLDVVPLNAIPFTQVVASNLCKKPIREEVPIPEWMKELDNYKSGDWKAFRETRVNGHKDWFYTHCKYQREFRSKPHVKLFMRTTLIDGTNMFNGRKLQKKRTMDSGGEGSGGSRPTSGKKSNTGTIKSKKTLSTGDQPTLPPGFV